MYITYEKGTVVIPEDTGSTFLYFIMLAPEGFICMLVWNYWHTSSPHKVWLSIAALALLVFGIGIIRKLYQSITNGRIPDDIQPHEDMRASRKLFGITIQIVKPALEGRYPVPNLVVAANLAGCFCAAVAAWLWFKGMPVPTMLALSSSALSEIFAGAAIPMFVIAFLCRDAGMSYKARPHSWER